MKKYINIGVVSNMGGSQIYLSNKIAFMEENDWEICIMGNEGEVLLDSLKKYLVLQTEELWYSPLNFSKKRINKILLQMERAIGDTADYEEVIIESGQISYSLWGEMLAKKIHAKHFAFPLSASFRTISQPEIDFCFFKLTQNAFAATTNARAEEVFCNYEKANGYEKKSLGACCSNSIADYDHFILKKIAEAGKHNYTIANCGRIDKPYTREFVVKTCKFADRFPNKSFLILFIGGREKTETGKIFQKIAKEHRNVTLFFTDLIFPIPLKLFQLCDVCVGSSGSAIGMQNPPVIFVDDLDLTPIGVLGYDGFTEKGTGMRYTHLSYDELLEEILIQQKYRQKDYCFHSFSDREYIHSKFVEHLEAYANIVNPFSYYDVLSMKISKKETAKKILFSVFGIRNTNRLIAFAKNFLFTR